MGSYDNENPLKQIGTMKINDSCMLLRDKAGDLYEKPVTFVRKCHANTLARGA